MVVHPPQIIAVRHRRERSVERQDLHPVARQVQFTDDLRPQQRDDVRRHRKFETRKDFFGNRRAAQHMPALTDKHLLAGPRKIRGMNKAVVPATNDRDVVVGSHLYQLAAWSRTG